MEVEILYFDGCPSYREARRTLEEVISKGNVTAEVRLVAVSTRMDVLQPYCNRTSTDQDVPDPVSTVSPQNTCK
jgi:hypothetical protein